MRPIRLSFSAFGSYAGEQNLDFTFLAGRSLFLIHGPTGSGKTTILDAICYALYGETSGGDRDPRQLRSDLADPGLLTRVTFEFSLGRERYRVTRCPEQPRPKKRGGGTTVERASATLWRVQEGAGLQVLATRWSRVNDEVERLLGFRSGQFRQVVMLPQGQFRQLLLASSRERQQILEVLFQTQFYRGVEEALKEAAKEIRDQAQQLHRRRELVLEQADAASEEALHAQREELAGRFDRAQGKITELQLKEQRLKKRLEEARETLGKLEELKTANKSLSSLEAREDEMRRERERLQRAREATALVDVERVHRQRLAEQETAIRDEGQAELLLRQAEQSAELAVQALERESGREEERQRAGQRLAQLVAAKDRVAALQEARHALDGAAQTASQHERTRGEAKQRLAESQARLLEARSALEAAREEAASVEARRADRERYQRALSLLQRLAARREELAAARLAYESSQGDLDRLDDELPGAREEIAALEQAWLASQAAVLAATLEDGSPCPVCGATSHPRLAAPADDLPSAQTVSHAREQLAALEEKREAARQELAHRHGAVISLSAEIVTLKESVAAEEPNEETSDEELGQELQRRLLEAEALLQQAERSRAATEGLQRAADRLEEEVVQRQRELEEAERRLSDACGQRAACEGVVREREQQIPKELLQLVEIDEAIRDAKRQARSLAEAMETARSEQQRAKEVLAGRREALRGAREVARAAHERSTLARSLFLERLEESGLGSEEAYLAAKLDPVALETLEERLQAYQAELGAARERLRRAEDACRDLQAPRLELLEAEEVQLRQELDHAIGERADLSTRARQVDGWLEELARLSRTAQQQEDRYKVFGRVADVAAGNNALKVSFSRFVLASLLDEVLVAASNRLLMMSKGRFHLQRTRVRSDLRRAGGLDLLVYDTYTGTERPVSTLSGGESFLAALALALGLAEIVRSHAGGMKLETIFVDEGFGSLDPEAFDLAFKALADLQDGGRLVGIISHMPELKEHVETCLEVRPGRGGSRIEVLARSDGGGRGA